MLGFGTDSFLHKRETNDLLADLEAFFGHEALHARLRKIEPQLLPMFNALPKMHDDRVAHTTARYALDRLFVKMYGWSLAALALSESAANTS